MLLFELAKKLKMNTCFRCGKKIKSVADFSVDHKQSWLRADNPFAAFFDLTNVAFSHLDCNCNAAMKKRLPHGKTKSRHCKCKACIASRNRFNANWMADWRAKGKDKSRKNFKGA